MTFNCGNDFEFHKKKYEECFETMEKQVLFDKGVYVIGGKPYLFDESLFIEKKKEDCVSYIIKDESVYLYVNQHYIRKQKLKRFCFVDLYQMILKDLFMNKFFQYTLIILLIIGFTMNHQQQMLESLLKTPFEVFELTKTLVLSLCLWNGLLKVIQASRMMDHFTFLLRPILKFIYGKCIEEESLYQNLSSNLLANLLGLGTLATLSGLKAIQLLKEKGYQQAIMLLVVMNTAGFSILPTTMMTLRQSYHSKHLLAFYPYSLFIGFIISVVGILIIKVIDHE